MRLAEQDRGLPLGRLSATDYTAPADLLALPNVTVGTRLDDLGCRRDATAFHLEAGRLCVLVSLQRHACIVVARAGIADLLDAHPSDEPIHLGVRAKFPDGWEANHALLAHLANNRVRA